MHRTGHSRRSPVRGGAYRNTGCTRSRIRQVLQIQGIRSLGVNRGRAPFAPFFLSANFVTTLLQTSDSSAIATS
jgi:hypothetical protein